MATVERPDGVEIHYEVRGDEGPLIALASYWSWEPGVYSELMDMLVEDHRLLTYDLRGYGQSTRQGPYDMETDIGDLEAVLEAAGGNALVITVADGANRAARVAARRPDLIPVLACFGGGPLSLSAFEGTEAMIASQSVVDAFLDLVERDYRAALRTLLTSTNPQMSQDELRERVASHASYASGEAAAGRIRAWADDDPTEEGRAVGDRLWVFTGTDIAGTWLPTYAQRDEVLGKQFPQAQLRLIDPGPISNPGGAAEALRELSAPLRS